MVTRVNLPQGNIALGFVNVGGRRVPVTIAMEWMRVFTDLVERAGGTSASADLDTLTEAAYAHKTDARVDECLRSINELSIELASTRGELMSYRTRVEDLESALASQQMPPDLTARVQQLEDRLA